MSPPALCYGANPSTKMAALASSWPIHFPVILQQLIRIWQNRKQALSPLLSTFRGNLSSNMVSLASDSIAHFWLLLCKCWTKFDETWPVALDRKQGIFNKSEIIASTLAPIWIFPFETKIQKRRFFYEGPSMQNMKRCKIMAQTRNSMQVYYDFDLGSW